MAALNPAAQYATPPEFGGKEETECLNTTFPPNIRLCEGDRVTLKKVINNYVVTLIVQLIAIYNIFYGINNIIMKLKYLY